MHEHFFEECFAVASQQDPNFSSKPKVFFHPEASAHILPSYSQRDKTTLCCSSKSWSFSPELWVQSRTPVTAEQNLWARSSICTTCELLKLERTRTETNACTRTMITAKLRLLSKHYIILWKFVFSMCFYLYILVYFPSFLNYFSVFLWAPA